MQTAVIIGTDAVFNVQYLTRGCEPYLQLKSSSTGISQVITFTEERESSTP